MEQVEFYEFFLNQFRDIERQRDILMGKLRQGRGLWVISNQLAELEIRQNELDQIFISMKPWF